MVYRPASRFAAAKAWHPKECRVWEKDKHWAHHKEGERISRPGDHFALFYNKLGRIGHTGMVKDEDEDYITTVEGNTNGSGGREGDGVYIRKRLKKTLHCISRW